jgi:hypothetical protein
LYRALYAEFAQLVSRNGSEMNLGMGEEVNQAIVILFCVFGPEYSASICPTEVSLIK